MSADPAAFIRAHLVLEAVPLVPEIQLYQAEEPIGLWELTEGEYRSDQPPPFWAFAWAGGQGLARFLLDHPHHVAGLRVLDLASGAGLAAIAAARAGAAHVIAVDVDPIACAAIELNAALNHVDVDVHHADMLDGDGDGDGGAVDVVLAGDVFYSGSMSQRMLTFLRRTARAGVRVLVGDPGRAFLDRAHFDEVAVYEVPVRFELEGTRSMTTTVWRLTPSPR